MGVFSNKIKREQLKPGDHIYSWRHAYLYNHHGIYVGEGKVVHFTRGVDNEIGTGTVLDRFIFSCSPSYSLDSPCQICGYQSKLDGVISSCLDCFLSGGQLYRFEYGVSQAFFLAQARGGTCTRAPSDRPEDVLHRTSYLLQNGFGVYDLFKNNCEDFAMYCKTGLLACVSVGRSGQATSFSAATSTICSLSVRFLTTSLPVVVVASFGTYCANRLASDIGVRQDVTKVPVEELPRSDKVSDLVSEASTETVKIMD